MGGPLEGINVLDLGTAGVGPWAATVLGFLGANVIKVERPGGDRLHNMAPLQRELSTTYTVCNLNKRNIFLDLKDPQGKKHMERLVQEADVVMENLRPGALEKLGFGYEELWRINPQIVYVSCPGWGFQGPMQNLPALDPLVQAFSGFAGLNGTDPSKPKPVQYPHLDFNASCFFAATVLLALLARGQNGESQRATCTQLGSTITLQISRIAEHFATGANPIPRGSACASTVPHQAFLCQDQKYLAVGVERDDQWRGLCRALEVEELEQDSRFSTNVGRVEHREELIPKLEELFLSKPTRWWDIKLSRERVPHGYFNDFETLRNHRHILENEYLVELNIPHQGPLYVGGLPWRFSKTPASLVPAASPGQHLEEVLQGGFNGEKEARPKPTPQGREEAVLPLAGKRVVDVTQGMCGPFASLLLAEAGAEVIKVEPPQGDYARGFAPQYPSGESALFIQLNRSKKVVTLDIAQEDGKRALQEMIQKADIFLEDWGPGGAEALGLNYETLEQRNPRLIFCHLTPFGDKGPMAHLPGSELVLQAMSEYWATVTTPAESPGRIGADIASLNTGCMAFIGILAALLHRESSGSGQRVDVSMLGTLMCLRGAMWAAISSPDEWYGLYCDSYANPARISYQTKDRPVYLNFNNNSEEDYVSLLAELDMVEVLADPRFQEGGRDAIGTGRYAKQLAPTWNHYLQSRSAQEVIDLFLKYNGMGCWYNSLEEALESEQVQGLTIVSEMDHPTLGKLRFIRPPWKGPWGEISLEESSLYQVGAPSSRSG